MSELSGERAGVMDGGVCTALLHWDVQIKISPMQVNFVLAIGPTSFI